MVDKYTEAVFERKAEKMLRGQRELPNGRDFRCWTERFRSDTLNDDFDQRYDDTFPDAPGLGNLDSLYCGRCDKRKVWCEC